eukprot:COSAG01_NODE_542_length_15693_cov_13.246253_7_plen_88_part_00
MIEVCWPRCCGAKAGVGLSGRRALHHWPLAPERAPDPMADTEPEPQPDASGPTAAPATPERGGPYHADMRARLQRFLALVGTDDGWT